MAEYVTSRNSEGGSSRSLQDRTELEPTPVKRLIRRPPPVVIISSMPRARSAGSFWPLKALLSAGTHRNRSFVYHSKRQLIEAPNVFSAVHSVGSLLKG